MQIADKEGKVDEEKYRKKYKRLKKQERAEARRKEEILPPLRTFEGAQQTSEFKNYVPESVQTSLKLITTWIMNTRKPQRDDMFPEDVIREQRDVRLLSQVSGVLQSLVEASDLKANALRDHLFELQNTELNLKVQKAQATEDAFAAARQARMHVPVEPLVPAVVDPVQSLGLIDEMPAQSPGFAEEMPEEPLRPTDETPSEQ